MTATRKLMHAVLVLAVVAATAAAARAATWQTHEYATDGFAVDFSSTVKVSPLTVNAETMASLVRTTNYTQDGGETYVYMVAASLFKDDVNFDFEAGVKGTMDTYKCKVIESDTSSSSGPRRAREIHGTQCHDGTIRVGSRFMIDGHWFYQVVYLIAPAANKADAEHFLQSFKLIGK